VTKGPAPKALAWLEVKKTGAGAYLVDEASRSPPAPRSGMSTGLARFTANLRAIPRSFATSFYRSGTPRTDRSRSSFIFSSLFLHFHSVRVHRWALRWSTTLGLGVISISAFLITLVTGILLMFYYKPYPSAAYDSIKDIHFVVPTGQFMRNIHRWAAQVMVVAVILHMARAFYTAAYRAPREFNWVMGWGSSCSPSASPSPAISCPGTSSPTGRSRSARTSPSRRAS